MTDQSLPRFADKNGDNVRMLKQAPHHVPGFSMAPEPATLVDLIDQVTALSAEQAQAILDAVNPWAKNIRDGIRAERDAANARIAELEREVEGMKGVVEAARALKQAEGSYRPRAWWDAKDFLWGLLRAFDAGTPAAHPRGFDIDAEEAKPLSVAERVRLYGKAMMGLPPSDRAEFTRLVIAAPIGKELKKEGWAFDDALMSDLHDLRGQVARLTEKHTHQRIANQMLRAEVATLTGSLEEAKRQLGEEIGFRRQGMAVEQRLRAENEKLRAERDPARIREMIATGFRQGQHADEIRRVPLVTDVAPPPREEVKCPNCSSCDGMLVPLPDCPVHSVRNTLAPSEARPEPCPECAYYKGMHRETLPLEQSAKCGTCGRWYEVTKAEARPEVDDEWDDAMCNRELAAGSDAVDAIRAIKRRNAKIRELEAELSDRDIVGAPGLYEAQRRILALHATLNDILAVSGDNPRVRELVDAARKGAGK